MKKIIFLFTLLLVIAIIYGNKQSAQNKMEEKYSQATTPNDFKRINKPEVREFKTNWKSFTQKKAPEGRPENFLIRNDVTEPAAWSPSLWWTYQYSNTVQTGC